MPLGDEPRELATPILASNFLKAVPYLPVQRLWLYWQVSSVNPDRARWASDTFFNKSWPVELGGITFQPHMTISLGGLIIQATVSNKACLREGETYEDSTVFECHVSRGTVLTTADMEEDLLQGPEWLSDVARIVRQLLGNESLR